MKALTVAFVAVLTVGLGARTASASTPDETGSVSETTSLSETTDPVDTSAPIETTTPDTSGSTVPGSADALVGVDETGSTDAGTATWIAIVAALALVGLAVWWMLRRTDDDGPPVHPGDDWPTESEVI